MIFLLMLYHVLRVTLLYSGQRWPALGDWCVHIWLRSCCWYVFYKTGALGCSYIYWKIHAWR